MRKTTLAALALALPLTIGSAWATTTLGSYTHDYGIGQFDPGGNDKPGNGFVTVSDASSDRFSDSFSLNGLSFSSIDSFSLTLTYSDVRTYSTMKIFGIPVTVGEKWWVRPGATATDSGFTLNASETKTSQTFTINSNTDTFASMVAKKNFYFWLAEETLTREDFRLYSAKLDVVGTAAPIPEPESYAMLLAGLAMMGTIARRRAGKDN